MKIAVDCLCGGVPHFDHWECDKCGSPISHIKISPRDTKKWKFCPYCGESLNENYDEYNKSNPS